MNHTEDTSPSSTEQATASDAPHPVTVTAFGSAYDKTPRYQDAVSWAELVERELPEALALETRRAPRDASEEAFRDAKCLLGGLVFAHVDGTLCGKNVGPHTALTLDVDHPTKDLLAKLEGYRCFAYESPSAHQPGKGLRLKLVVALAEPCPPHAVKAARTKLAVELGLDPKASGVDGANAVAQLAFIGRVKGTPAREYWTYDGEPWAFDASTVPRTKDGPETYGEASEPIYGADRKPDLSAIAAAVAELGADGKRSGGRMKMRAIGGYLARDGYHPDAIADAVLEQIPSNQPETRAKEARQGALDVYAGKSDTAGWKLLNDDETGFGAVVMAEVERANTDPWVSMLCDKWADGILRGDALREWYRQRGVLVVANDADDVWISAAQMAEPLPPVEYWCERLAITTCDTRVDMLVGPPAGGKTGLAQAYALAVASGTPLFGDPEFAVRQGAVRHIDNEQGVVATLRRYQRLAKGAGIDMRALGTSLKLLRDGLRLTSGERINETAVDRLTRLADGAKLIVIDSLVTLGMGIDENSVAFGEVMMRLRGITGRTGARFLLIHHSGKGESTKDGRGTSAIDGEKGSTWVVDDGFTWRHRKKATSDTGEFRRPFTTRWDDDPLTPGQAVADVLSAARITLVGAGESRSDGLPTRSEKQAVAMFVHKNPGASQRTVTAGLKGAISSKGRATEVIKFMTEARELQRSGTDKHGLAFEYHLAAEGRYLLGSGAD